MVQVDCEISIRSLPEKIGKTLFNLELFQRHMEDVKEIRILERDVLSGRQKSVWKVEMEGIELNWLEEENLDLEKGQMEFRLLAGDFKEFRGKWEFWQRARNTANELSTLVLLTVQYDLGMPGFDELIGENLRLKVVRNSRRLLTALKTCLEGEKA